MNEQIINKFERTKVIVDVEGIYGEACAMLAKALRSGIELLELVLRDGNHQKVWDTLHCLQQIGTLVTVGVGNVCTAYEVQMAKAYGAEFSEEQVNNGDWEQIRENAQRFGSTL